MLTPNLPRSIRGLYHRNDKSVTMRDEYLIVPDHDLDTSFQRANLSANMAEESDVSDATTDDTRDLRLSTMWANPSDDLSFIERFPDMPTTEIYKYYKQGLESGVKSQAEMVSYIERLGNRSSFFEEIDTGNDYDDDDDEVPVTSTDETNDTNNEDNNEDEDETPTFSLNNDTIETPDIIENENSDTPLVPFVNNINNSNNNPYAFVENNISYYPSHQNTNELRIGNDNSNNISKPIGKLVFVY